MTVPLTKPVGNLVTVSAPNEVLYTLCPGPQASYFAVHHGWTEEELAKVGAKLTYLRSIPDTEQLWPHVGHRSESLIREGGNWPPIWARADISDTRLIATLTTDPSGGQILVRTTSRFYRVADLAGKKIGLLKGRNTRKLDFGRVPAHRGIIDSLRLAGLSDKDVTIVDIEHDDFEVEKPSRHPAERAGRFARKNPEEALDVQALASGEIDAILSSDANARYLTGSGRFKAIEDLSRHPDWTLTGASSPVITVSAKLAAEHPEYIVAYLRAAIRGGRWVNENPLAAAEIFNGGEARPQSVRRLAEAIGARDFVPNLAPQALAGLEVQKAFLLEYGYIRNDFDIRDWVAPQFLQEALASF
ncbi:MAG: ABC transporter substrate-binding protein [Methylocystaceae bacterium]|nr:MAG: ABC transporter substrate-binding protein [Methylocystaceae bacterium]